MLAAGVEVAETPVFIFRASSSGLGAGGALLLLLPGLGSRLMTGMTEVVSVGKGAAKRLLKVVVVELVKQVGWLEVVAWEEGVFSGSGANQGNQK